MWPAHNTTPKPCSMCLNTWYGYGFAWSFHDILDNSTEWSCETTRPDSLSGGDFAAWGANAYFDGVPRV